MAGPKRRQKSLKHVKTVSTFSTLLVRKRRTWAIAVRRRSCKSLFLLNSGRFSPRNIGKFSSEVQEESELFRTRSTKTRDRNLQLRGAVSTGFS